MWKRPSQDRDGGMRLREIFSLPKDVVQAFKVGRGAAGGYSGLDEVAHGGAGSVKLLAQATAASSTERQAGETFFLTYQCHTG